MAGKKKRGIGWRTRALGAVLLVVLVAASWGWWRLQHWTPDAAKYPDQGAEIDAADGAVRFDTLKARLLQLHPYELPELVAVPVTHGHDAYLDWVRANAAG